MGRRRSPQDGRGDDDGEQRLSLQDQRGQPGGQTRCHRRVQKPELPGRHEQPDECEVAPRDLRARHERHDRQDAREPDRHEQQRRHAGQPLVDDDEVEPPDENDEQRERDVAWGHEPHPTAPRPRPEERSVWWPFRASEGASEDAHALVLVQGFEHPPDLVALGHRDDIHRRPRQDHVGTLALGIDLKEAEPLLAPLATVGIVVILVVFILLYREDLRDRIIRLAGARDLHRTLAAMDDDPRRSALLMSADVHPGLRDRREALTDLLAAAMAAQAAELLDAGSGRYALVPGAPVPVRVLSGDRNEVRRRAVEAALLGALSGVTACSIIRT